MAPAYNGGMLGLHPSRQGSIPCGATSLKIKNMTFTCTHCEKPINCMPILIDKTHFVHPQCEAAFNEVKEKDENEEEIAPDLSEA